GRWPRPRPGSPRHPRTRRSDPRTHAGSSTSPPEVIARSGQEARMESSRTRGPDPPGGHPMKMEQSDIRAIVRVGVGILAFLVVVEILWSTPTSMLAIGAVEGTLSALIAIGLVLIYRANRIVNFAQF